MSNPPVPENDSLARQQQLDAVCDRFERKWQVGNRPRIEVYLCEMPENRAELLRELIQIDAYYLQQQGHTVSAQDYLERYPELEEEWVQQHVPQTIGDSKYKDGLNNLTLDDANFDTLETTQTSGRSIFRDYELLEKIAAGGMGVVWKARQRSLKRIVALKMILWGEDSTVDQLARFRREAEAVANLTHPGIVQIYEIGEHEGRPFFAMEYVDGGSLKDRINGTPWAVKQAAQLVERLARTVHVVHQQNIVHRDLKPANVLFTHDGQPKIADFGLAKNLADPTGQTRSGAVFGTASYMAPEQASGQSKSVTPATDVYFLGAILYELVTGRPPHKAETPLGTAQEVIHIDPVPPTQLNSRLPRDLETILLKAISKEPE